MYDLVYDEPPMTAEDVLDGEELARYREEKALRLHARTCRDHFCERCNPPADEPTLWPFPSVEDDRAVELDEDIPF